LGDIELLDHFRRSVNSGFMVEVPIRSVLTNLGIQQRSYDLAIEITEEMKTLINHALADKYPCILGTASLDGHPNLSYKGSLMVFSTKKLAFWERARKGGFAQLTANPNVVVMYRNGLLRKAWRFYGQASVHEHGEIREQVMERTVRDELDRDPDRLGAAVVITVTRISTLGGEVLQEGTI